MGKILAEGIGEVKLQDSKGVGFALEMLEVEYSFMTNKLGRMQEKVKTLESSIETTRNEVEYPTKVETELKQKLGLLTDHFIQKQAQVETLTSEKASLLFRIEIWDMYCVVCWSFCFGIHDIWRIDTITVHPQPASRFSMFSVTAGLVMALIGSLFTVLVVSSIIYNNYMLELYVGYFLL